MLYTLKHVKNQSFAIIFKILFVIDNLFFKRKKISVNLILNFSDSENNNKKTYYILVSKLCSSFKGFEDKLINGNWFEANKG